MANFQRNANKLFGEPSNTTARNSGLVASLFDKKHLQGTKYDGSRGGMIASALDNDIISDKRTVKQRNLGRGRVKLEFKEGDSSEGINIGGRIHYPNAQNEFVIIDQGVIDVMLDQEKQRRSYLEDMIERCSYSDEIAAQLCGKNTVDELKRELGAGGRILGLTLDDDLVAASGMPSDIEVLAEDSIAYSRAIKKLKLYVSQNLPAIENYTTSKTVNEDAA